MNTLPPLLGVALAVLVAAALFACSTRDPNGPELPRLTEDAPESDLPADEGNLATFGAGCFWCIEAVLEQVDGIEDVVSGYMGGHVENPTYKQVSSGKTGHTEVVQVLYDPAKIGYDQLLQVFWRNIDPTVTSAPRSYSAASRSSTQSPIRASSASSVTMTVSGSVQIIRTAVTMLASRPRRRRLLPKDRRRPAPVSRPAVPHPAVPRPALRRRLGAALLLRPAL